ncbi:MAG: hypothetical protein CSA84_02620 [Actinomycetales bacterium]|nr:MAG: hypothetical protein CSA84_02620 [Actinomycetales bacterium]
MFNIEVQAGQGNEEAAQVAAEPRLVSDLVKGLSGDSTVTDGDVDSPQETPTAPPGQATPPIRFSRPAGP